MRRWCVYALTAAVAATGCTSRLSVKKVPGDEDKKHCVKGFRYYLSRPYVIVQEPILVSEQIKVGKYNPKQIPPEQFVARSAVELKGKGAREVAVAELEAMRAALGPQGVVQAG